MEKKILSMIFSSFLRILSTAFFVRIDKSRDYLGIGKCTVILHEIYKEKRLINIYTEVVYKGGG